MNDLFHILQISTNALNSKDLSQNLKFQDLSYKVLYVIAKN
jgi:hypothetical protein